MDFHALRSVQHAGLLEKLIGVRRCSQPDDLSALNNSKEI